MLKAEERKKKKEASVATRRLKRDQKEHELAEKDKKRDHHFVKPVSISKMLSSPHVFEKKKAKNAKKNALKHKWQKALASLKHEQKALDLASSKSMVKKKKSATQQARKLVGNAKEARTKY